MMISTKSVTGMFLGVNSIQMIDLLPILAYYMSYEVVTFIAKSSFSLFDFSIIPVSSSFISTIFEKIDYAQNYWYFRMLNLDSGSTIVNIKFSVIFVMFCLLLTLLSLLFKWMSNRNARSKRYDEIRLDPHQSK